MTVRTPLYYLAPTGQPQAQIYPFTTTMMTQLKEMAGHAYALNPNPRIEVNSGVGTVLANQPFVDTYMIAGASTTNVSGYATEAATPNISMVTENYSRLTVVTDAVSLPTGDTNNHQYPLYLYSPTGLDEDIGFRSMTVTDFVDTFITADVLAQFGGGGQSLAKGGTYYVTNDATPNQGTLTGTTHFAQNKVADVAAYTSGGIPETTNQVNIQSYYIAKVNYSPTVNGLWDTGALYDLPLYFDAGSDQIKQHTPATWAALLNPFLRYFLSPSGGTQYAISYNVDGADGVTNGLVYTDTRTSGVGGSGYNTRFVGVDDYRTQEFPNGTASVISSKRFKIHQGPGSAPVAMPNTPYVCSAVSSGLSGSCTAQINVNSNGSITGTGTNGNPSSDGSLPQTWYSGGNPELYQVRWNYTSNLSGGGTITSPGDNVWLGLNISRSWSIYDTSNTAGNNTMSGLMEIREISTGTVWASGTVLLSADQEP